MKNLEKLLKLGLIYLSTLSVALLAILTFEPLLDKVVLKIPVIGYTLNYAFGILLVTFYPFVLPTLLGFFGSSYLEGKHSLLQIFLFWTAYFIAVSMVFSFQPETKAQLLGFLIKFLTFGLLQPSSEGFIKIFNRTFALSFPFELLTFYVGTKLFTYKQKKKKLLIESTHNNFHCLLLFSYQ